MVKSFKFLLQFVWVNLAVLLGFAAAVTLGAWATGVPQGESSLFRTYFFGFPTCALLMLFLLTCSLCTSNLNMAISFGARRRDFFWAVQGAMVFYTLACWAIQAAMSAIPTVFHWAESERAVTMMSPGGVPGFYPLALLSVSALGCLCGLALARSKVLGSVLFTLTFLAAMALLVIQMVIPFTRGGLWGDLPLILFLVTLTIFMVSEIFIWRTVRRYAVR